MVGCLHVNILSKVGLYALHTHIQQVAQQTFIPFCCLVVCEVDGSGLVECREVRAFRSLLFEQRTNIIILFRLCNLLGTVSDIRQLPE